MRYILICGSLALAALSVDARTPAQSSPWCANYTFGGGMTCGFSTMDQCLATVRGVGGSCLRNPAEPETRGAQAPARSRTTTREQPVEQREPKVRQTSKRPERVERPERRERVRERPETPPEEPTLSSGTGSPPRVAPFDPPPVVAPPPETPPPRASLAPSEDTARGPTRSLSLPSASTIAPAPAGLPVAATPAAPLDARFFVARDLILAGKNQAGLTAMQALDRSDNADVAAYIGLAYSKLGRQSDAKTWYEKALTVDPNHLLALAYSGMLRAEQGDVSNAQGYLDKIKGICGGTGCYEYAALQAVIASKRP